MNALPVALFYLTTSCICLSWTLPARIHTPAAVDCKQSSSSKPWPAGIIPFKFDGAFNESEKQLIRRSMQEFHESTCVRFHELPQHKDAPANAAYLLINKGVTCSSNVGWANQIRTLFLSQNCLLRKYILHELMHILGFEHEHQRYDRDNYVKFIPLGERENDETDLKIEEFLEESRDFRRVCFNTFGKTYDYYSVTHYPNLVTIATGTNEIRMLIEPNNENYERYLGMHNLSPGDIDRVNLLYNCTVH